MAGLAVALGEVWDVCANDDTVIDVAAARIISEVSKVFMDAIVFTAFSGVKPERRSWSRGVRSGRKERLKH
jgi:hypothetical protein